MKVEMPGLHPGPLVGLNEESVIGESSQYLLKSRCVFPAAVDLKCWSRLASLLWLRVVFWPTVADAHLLPYGSLSLLFMSRAPREGMRVRSCPPDWVA